MEFLKNLKTNIVTFNPVTWVILLFLVISLLLSLTFLPTRKEIMPQSALTPTPRISTTPTPFAPAKFSYPKDQVDKLLAIVKARPALSPSDLAIRNRLIASLGSQSGILYQSSRFDIEYVKAPNSFMVAVKTIDITQVKNDATSWFAELGLSKNGICNFPVIFYPAIPQKALPPGPIPFNPLPEGC